MLGYRLMCNSKPPICKRRRYRIFCHVTDRIVTWTPAVPWLAEQSTPAPTWSSKAPFITSRGPSSACPAASSPETMKTCRSWPDRWPFNGPTRSRTSSERVIRWIRAAEPTSPSSRSDRCRWSRDPANTICPLPSKDVNYTNPRWRLMFWLARWVAAKSISRATAHRRTSLSWTHSNFIHLKLMRMQMKDDPISWRLDWPWPVPVDQRQLLATRRVYFSHVIKSPRWDLMNHELRVSFKLTPKCLGVGLVWLSADCYFIGL